MKTRNGFVSNSSSSSFIVIMKNGDKMTKDALLESFDVKKSSPLYGFAKDLTKWITSNLVEYGIKEIHDNYIGNYDNNYDKRTLTEDDMINEILDEGIEIEILTKNALEKIKNKEYRYYEGSASNDEGGLESYLCDEGINVDTDTIKIKSGGY